MADVTQSNTVPVQTRKPLEARAGTPVHPAWLRLMRYCAELGHGEIEKLKIQDGLPIAAEVTTKKVKFSS